VIGWALRLLVIWGATGMLIYAVVGDGAFFRRVLHPPASPPAAAAATTPSPGAAAAEKSLVFHANRQGHVVLDAVVNGAPVHFLVDTGATFVALSRRDAAAAGFTDGDLVFRGRMATANGVVGAAPVRLRELRIGQFSVGDVPAVVMDHLGISLLGQSFLNRLDSYEMRDGVLTLNWN
jgi:aspartyl protease family protein